MLEKVINTINKYNLIHNNDKIVLGVSGGPDSMAMLHVLNNIKKAKKYSFELVVAHINHGLRIEADSEEEFVKEFCDKEGIPFYSKKIDLLKYAKDKSLGIEEAGRYIRYDFFDEILIQTKSNKIAIAHNKNDKAETIILNILRGTGITGLKGIDIKRDTYIRPILECTREEIEQYCDKEEIHPKIDKSNFENIYRRNKIRNIVIPFIKEEFNPNIVNTLDRLSELVCEEEEYINMQVEKEYKNILIKDNKYRSKIDLDLKKFNASPKVIKSRIIIYTIIQIFGTSKGIEKIHIDDIIKLCDKNVGNKYIKPNMNTKISINKGIISFEKVKSL